MSPQNANLVLKNGLKDAKASSKRLSMLSSSQAGEFDEDFYSDPNDARVKDLKKNDGGLFKKLSMVFNANAETIRTMEQNLAYRYEDIQDITSQFEMYITVIQHEMNSFDEMGKELYEI